ncbi:MAG: TetR/AcrR family transcriptional regulator [Acidimicrobiales bacterium]
MEPLTQERRRRQTREHLLAAAAEVFAHRGYHEATLEEIAAAAGFTKGAVYSNFASKEDLFLTLTEVHVDEMLSRVRTMIDSSDVPAGDRLEEFARLAAENFEREKSSSALYMEFWLYASRHPKARERLAAIDRAQSAAIESMVKDDQKRRGAGATLQADVMAKLVVALFHGIGVVGMIDPDAVDTAFFEAAVQMVDRGLSED